MLNTKLKKLSGLLLLGTTLTLTGCDLFDNDSDKSSDNLVQLSGNALKGAMANADVGLFHFTDVANPVLTTTTDANGDYEISGVLDDTGVYLITVTANDNTTMLCDVANCGTAAAPIAFGETVPSSALVGVKLSNVTFIEESVEPVTVTAQVNAVTSIATELFVSSLEEANPDLAEYTQAQFSTITKTVTQTVAAMFGVETSADTNVFTLELPNLNDSTETSAAGAAESGFSIINAAITTSTSENIAESIQTVIETVVTLAETDPEDTGYAEAANAWIDVQDVVMDEAVAVADNPEITLSEEAAEAVTEIKDAANEGIDLEEIEKAKDEQDDCVDGGCGPTGGTGGNG